MEIMTCSTNKNFNYFQRRKSSSLFHCKVQGNKQQSTPFLDAFACLVESPVPTTTEPDAKRSNTATNDTPVNVATDDISAQTSSNSYTRPSYQTERANLSANWRKLEKELLSTAVDLCNNTCSVCISCHKDINGTEDDIIRCNDCQPYSIFCSSCFCTLHQHIWSHRPLVWKVIFVTFLHM